MTEPGKHAAALPGVIAVTGASGLIGRRLLPLLSQTSVQLRVLARHGSPSPFTTVVQGDVRDRPALRQLVQGAGAIVHLAGVAHTTLSTQQQQDEAHAINVAGTRTLLEEAQHAGVSRFLFVSSAHVYAGQRGLNLSEGSPVSPDGPYAAMKLAAEFLVAEAAARGMSTAILRPCLTYGPGVQHNLQSLLRALQRGRFVQVRGAQTIRSMASVDTVAATIVHLLQQPNSTGHFNIADREPVDLERWVEHLADLMGARRPPSLFFWILKSLATAGTTAAALGLPAPLTRKTLVKLITPFSLDVSRLAATGFQWPSTQDAVLRAMIAAEFQRPGDAKLTPGEQRT